jgi:hypothetical protein
VIAWSYELCGDKQRLLFDRLSAFAPGYETNPEDAGTGVADLGAELDAIGVVCADDVPIEGCDAGPATRTGDPARPAVGLARKEIRELLDRLVEQSLVSTYITADTVRYFLLESLRVFASDRLAERSAAEVDEPARLARRHVPLFYFVAHFMLIHVVAVVVCWVKYGNAQWMFESPNRGAYPFLHPPGWGFSLPVIYAIWVGVVVGLYPLCRWMAAVKAQRRHWWLSYV